METSMACKTVSGASKTGSATLTTWPAAHIREQRIVEWVAALW